MTVGPARSCPGGAAAFRQRYEAHGLLARITDEVGAAQSALGTDKPADAAARLGEFLQRVEQNPTALDMLSARQPAALAEERTAPTKVVAIRESQASAGIWADRDSTGRTEQQRDRDVQGQAPGPSQRRGTRHAAE